jgi:predicted ATPase
LVAALSGTGLPDAKQRAGFSAQTRFAAWLATLTGGQPFFIMETLRALLEEGVLALCPDAAGSRILDVCVALREPERLQSVIPARVQEVIKTRLGRLGQTAMALLVAGAALGTRCTFEQLCHITEVSEREALDGLEEVVRTHLLREDSMGQYTFCYDMVRAVVCMQAGAARRQVFWRRAHTLAKGRSSAAPAREMAVTASLSRTRGSDGDRVRHQVMAASTS